MGLYFGSRRSCSKYDRNSQSPSPATPVTLPNPDPYNYEILEYREIYDHLVVRIKYHDCTNYEGEKVLLYFNTTLEELKAQKYIDPHFCDNPEFKSPFARFEPTIEGFHVAEQIALMEPICKWSKK